MRLPSHRGLATLALAGLSSLAMAQSTKPLTLIVPFAPGGGSDTSARLISNALGNHLGQTVIIENKPGAAGVIGADQVARAHPDGSTVLLGNIGTQSINPILYKKLPYDAKTAFAPVSLIAELPQVLLVHPGVPAKDVPSLIALLKTQPGKLSYSTSGAGSSMHLAGAIFRDDPVRPRDLRPAHRRKGHHGRISPSPGAPGSASHPGPPQVTSRARDRSASACRFPCAPQSGGRKPDRCHR